MRGAVGTGADLCIDAGPLTLSLAGAVASAVFPRRGDVVGMPALVPSILLLLASVIAGCAPRPSAPPVAPTDVERADWAQAFEEVGAVGTFVLRDLETGRTQRYDPGRAAERMLPASTFKVYNALVALETGVVSDPDSAFAWDGVERFLPAWNQDQSLRDGLRNSTVWVYQRVARRVGRDRYRRSFKAEPYGNSQIGPDVGLFWLDESLRVSADEQVQFIERLHAADWRSVPACRRPSAR